MDLKAFKFLVVSQIFPRFLPCGGLENNFLIRLRNTFSVYKGPLSLKAVVESMPSVWWW